MASVKITINGVICDMYGRTISGPVKIVGEAMYSDLGVGGGPMPPGPGGGGGEGIWGPTDPRPGWGLPGDQPHPEHPIAPGGRPPGTWGGAGEGFPTPPIYIPPAVPPSMKPPEAPEPGSPTTSVPGNWPTQPITPPEYIVVQYPGIGPVIVAPPAQAEPKA